MVENCRLGAFGGPFTSRKINVMYGHLRDEHLATAISVEGLRRSQPNLTSDRIKFPDGYTGPVWMVKGYAWAENQIISFKKGKEAVAMAVTPQASSALPVEAAKPELVLSIALRVPASQPRKLHCPTCGTEMMIQAEAS